MVHSRRRSPFSSLRRSDVDKIIIGSLGSLLECLVDLFNGRIHGLECGIHRVERQEALHIDGSLGAGFVNFLYEVDQFLENSDIISFGIFEKVVASDQEEDLVGLLGCDFIKSEFDTLNHVTGDSAVENREVETVEKIVPFCVIGEAVTEHNHAVTLDGKRTEYRYPVQIIV